LREDVARRDFTMNAIAYSPTRGLIDHFGGEADIRAGIIRCVGDPDTRFREDALRMMRGIRFASVLGFRIEENTAAAIRGNKERIPTVSAERIRVELTKLLCGVNVKNVLMDWWDVLGVVIPEILPMHNFDQKTPYHIYDVWEHTAVAVSETPPVTHLRLSAFLHDIGKPSSFFTDEKGIGTITVTCDCEPYKYKIAKTVVTRAIDGTEIVNLTNSRKRAVPTITTTSEMTVSFGGGVWTNRAGTYTIPELELVEGDNLVAVTGNGTITFTWQEGDL
jgi:hypothetical protein